MQTIDRTVTRKGGGGTANRNKKKHVAWQDGNPLSANRRQTKELPVGLTGGKAEEESRGDETSRTREFPEGVNFV